VDETQAGLDDERVTRLEREAQTLKRVGEDIFRLQEKLDLERISREQTLGMVGQTINAGKIK
jgi:endonuclease/exonuclease/phosphatase family metal-dependent hydrolase